MVRSIENEKERLITILIAPFMSCSARLPVYALFVGVFFKSLSISSSAKSIFIRDFSRVDCQHDFKSLYFKNSIRFLSLSYLLSRAIL